MKYLLLLALIGVIWWRWKKRHERPTRFERTADPKPENMVVCCHCGVHLPESDALNDGGQIFCGQAHLQAVRAKMRG